MTRHTRRMTAKALYCIDVSHIPEYARVERAIEITVCLKEILDRVELPDWEQVPGSEAIEAAGGYEKLPSWQIPGTRVLITRITEGEHQNEYLFSQGTGVFRTAADATLSHDPAPKSPKGFYDWYFSMPGNSAIAPIVKMLPEKMQTGRTFGMANWKWPGVLLAGLAMVFLMGLMYRFQFRSGPAISETNLWLYILTLVFPIAAVLVPLGFGAVVRELPELEGETRFT